MPTRHWAVVTVIQGLLALQCPLSCEQAPRACTGTPHGQDTWFGESCASHPEAQTSRHPPPLSSGVRALARRPCMGIRCARQG